MQDLVTILRDPMVRTILATFAICVTVTLFLVARRRKRLSYSLTDTLVIGIHEGVNPSRVQILFDAEPVTEVHLVTITVNNSGNEPVRADDFERPLRFSWPMPAKILTADVIEASPETLKPTIKAGANEIAVDPLLLNPGDSFRIKTLINKAANPSIDGRAVGVKRITNVSANATSDKLFRLFMTATAIAVVAVLTITSGEGLRLWAANAPIESRIVFFAVLGMLIVLVEIVRTGARELASLFKKKNDPK